MICLPLYFKNKAIFSCKNMTPRNIDRYRRANQVVGFFHFIQAITTTVLVGTHPNRYKPNLILPDFRSTNTTIRDVQVLYTSHSNSPLDIGACIPIYFMITALSHFLLGPFGMNSRYKTWLDKEYNPLRWCEYGITASIMIFCITALSFELDLSSLFLVMICSISTMGFGYCSEYLNQQPGGNYTILESSDSSQRRNWLPYCIGWIPGLGMWFPSFLNLALSSGPGGAQPPRIVIGIISSLFILYNIFGLIAFLHLKRLLAYQKIEICYLVASFVAKTTLGWQIMYAVL